MMWISGIVICAPDGTFSSRVWTCLFSNYHYWIHEYRVSSAYLPFTHCVCFKYKEGREGYLMLNSAIYNNTHDEFWPWEPNVTRKVFIKSWRHWNNKKTLLLFGKNDGPLAESCSTGWLPLLQTSVESMWSQCHLNSISSSSAWILQTEQQVVVMCGGSSFSCLSFLLHHHTLGACWSGLFRKKWERSVTWTCSMHRLLDRTLYLPCWRKCTFLPIHCHMWWRPIACTGNRKQQWAEASLCRLHGKYACTCKSINTLCAIFIQ